MIALTTKNCSLWLLALGLLVVAPVAATSASNPTSIGTYNVDTSIDATDVFVDGNYAYLVRSSTANTQPEFFVFDVSNPASPILKSSLDIGYTVNDVFVSFNRAYLATNNPNRELLVIDVANKSAPTVASWYNAPGATRGLSVVATQMAGWTEYFSTFRIYLGLERNNAGPEFVVLNGAPSIAPVALGTLELGGDLRSISAGPHAVFVGTGRSNKEFGVINVANPAAPAEVWSYDIPGSSNTVYGIQRSGNRVYLATNNNNGNPDFYVFNATTNYVGGPAPTVSLAGAVNLNENNVGLAVVGSKAFVASRGTTTVLRVLDVSNPASITVSASYNEANTTVNGLSLGLGGVFLATGHNSRELTVLSPGVALLPYSDLNSDGKITIGCYGDSNTLMAFMGDQARASWPEYLSQFVNLPGIFEVKNRGIGFAGAVNDGRTIWGVSLNAESYLLPMLDPLQIDVAVMAYGTNDIKVGHGPQEIVDAYLNLKAATEALDIPTFIALTPMDYSSNEEKQGKILELNNLLNSTLAPASIIDFFSTVTFPDDYELPGLHFLSPGHLKRGQAAYQLLIQ